MMQARRTSGSTNDAIGTFASPAPSGTQLLACPEGVSMIIEYFTHTHPPPHTHTPTHTQKSTVEDSTCSKWRWLRRGRLGEPSVVVTVVIIVFFFFFQESLIKTRVKSNYGLTHLQWTSFIQHVAINIVHKDINNFFQKLVGVAI